MMHIQRGSTPGTIFGIYRGGSTTIGTLARSFDLSRCVRKSRNARCAVVAAGAGGGAGCGWTMTCCRCGKNSSDPWSPVTHVSVE